VKEYFTADRIGATDTEVQQLALRSITGTQPRQDLKGKLATQVTMWTIAGFNVGTSRAPVIEYHLTDLSADIVLSSGGHDGRETMASAVMKVSHPYETVSVPEQTRYLLVNRGETTATEYLVSTGGDAQDTINRAIANGRVKVRLVETIPAHEVPRQYHLTTPSEAPGYTRTCGCDAKSRGPLTRTATLANAHKGEASNAKGLAHLVARDLLTMVETRRDVFAGGVLAKTGASYQLQHSPDQRLVEGIRAKYLVGTTR
jgi:hypothetical protein